MYYRTKGIQVKKNNQGSNHIKRTHSKNGKEWTREIKDEMQKVEVRTLDSYDFQNVDIIKVDAEGYEFPIVKGAEKTIMENLPVVQLEMIVGQAERFGNTPQEICDWFTERGFHITLNNGVIVDNEFKYYKKQVERFFIHESMLTTIGNVVYNVGTN